MWGSPKRVAFFGTPTRPYGSGTMFGVARMRLQCGTGPGLGYAFSAIPWPTLSLKRQFVSRRSQVSALAH